MGQEEFKNVYPQVMSHLQNENKMVHYKMNKRKRPSENEQESKRKIKAS